MKDQKLLFGILAAFVAGGVLTYTYMNGGMDLLTGSVTETEDIPQIQSCINHEECATGQVCREGTCAVAERTFCSQPFMLAESVEGRFIRYTLCENRCVRSGNSAFCE